MDVLGLLLAAEVEVEGGGFGLNPNILETNIINLVLIIALLFYAGRKFFGSMLSERLQVIETEIGDAEERRKTAAAGLAEQQQKLAQAKAEAEKILANAKASAEKSREVILANAKQDVERMKTSATQDINAERDRVVAELRQRLVALALQKAEAELPSRLDEGLQHRLVERSIGLIGG